MSKRENAQNPITPFAITDYRDIRRMFGIKEKNRRGHMYILGKTGTGKTTLMENMIISDMKAGNGVAVIDPHGDLAEDLLDFIPQGRIENTIYFNPSDLEYPMALNPLESVEPDQQHLVASGLMSVLRKLWPDFWGPRMEHILRNAILALLEYPKSTLLDLPWLLVDKEFRKRVLEHVTNPQVKQFWLTEFDRYSPWFRSETLVPIQNKVGQFLATPLMRNIMGQAKSAIDFRKVMDEGKILIVNLAKGRIGEDNCALLGAMIATRIELAALSRGDVPENKRKPFYLYVDEIHKLLTQSFADILSEARKYGLSLILTHQYLEQLDERMRAAILGNVGTLITFRIGSRDAYLLRDEFSPPFYMSDLINLPNYHIYLKLMIDGKTSRPFSAITLPPPEIKTSSYAARVIEASRRKFARPREEVEKMMGAGVWERKPPRRQMKML